MTAQGEDVLAYLDAAITAREEAARAVGYDKIETGDYLWGTKYLVLLRGDESKVAPEMDAELAIHIALNDPTSVLRRCAADRKILNQLWDLSQLSAAPGQPIGIVEQMALDAIRSAIQLLAEGYGRTEGQS